MKIDPKSKEWEERVRQSREEADMSISAGTARNLVLPSAIVLPNKRTIKANEIAAIQKLIDKYGKDRVIRCIESID